MSESRRAAKPAGNTKAFDEARIATSSEASVATRVERLNALLQKSRELSVGYDSDFKQELMRLETEILVYISQLRVSAERLPLPEDGVDRKPVELRTPDIT